MSKATAEELLSLNQQLLESIASGDWETYERLCDPSLEGMNFHRFYFELKPSRPGNAATTMASPKVRLLGDVAILSYVRLVQRLDEQQRPVTTACEETRVWQKQAGGWRHVHFHRSHNARA